MASHQFNAGDGANKRLEPIDPTEKTSGVKIVAVILLTWFCFAFAVGVSGVFRHASAPAVAITVWTLSGVVLLACWKIRSVRDWITIVDLRWLIALHLTRFVGVCFLILARHGKLPSAFATPAGYGDIFVAEMALLLLILGRDNTIRRHRVARRLYRKALVIWNTAGLLDILFVVFTALRIGLKNWEAMKPLRELPLSLLPTFFVPLIIASHVLIFVRFATRGRITS